MDLGNIQKNDCIRLPRILHVYTVLIASELVCNMDIKNDDIDVCKKYGLK